ncbi:MAG: molybdopterin-guanine dinucleotide biosynthesis protein B [Minwuia sp.]|nr:molybdopterin-guanine dinucleotide biosynthesis protein B [Minwuia sp.]
MSIDRRQAVLGIAGWSGSGKTTLITRLIPVLVDRGIRVSTVKHAHHRFDIDTPGKDTWRHRQAGATEVLIASDRRIALMRELRDEAEPGLDELLARLAPVDLVLVEGYKTSMHSKIEVHRAATGKPPLYPDDPTVLAVVSDAVTGIPDGRPVFGLDAIDAIADFAAAQVRS